MSDESQSNTPFQWPPKPGVDAGPPPAGEYWKPAPGDAARGRRVVREGREIEAISIDEDVSARWGWWHHVERVWLGMAKPPIAVRLHAAGWSPDVPADYCNRCGDTVGPGEAGPDGCAACAGERLPWSRALRLGQYEGVLREAVLELKFSRMRATGRVLGRLLGKRVAEAIAATGILPASVRIVPMPTTFRRRMARGIDHSTVLARAVADEASVAIGHVLTRKHTRPQATQSAAERERLVRGVFGSSGALDETVALWVVVDDVRTTGATMNGACSALQAALRGAGKERRAVKPAVWMAVVGVTPAAGRRMGPEDGVAESESG